jgi:ribosome-binding ATPase YchF (GTP1/OBG family)
MKPISKGPANWSTKVREAASSAQAHVVAVCAKLEAELAELDHDDRLEMLSDVGLT